MSSDQDSLNARIASLERQLVALKEQTAAVKKESAHVQAELSLEEYTRYGRQMIMPEWGMPGS